MADWKLTFPKLFKNREAFRAFVRTKITDASEAFFTGISLTEEQKAAITAYGEWCVVAIGVGVFVKSKNKKMLEKWNQVMKAQHKSILDRRIAWHLESIEKATNERRA